MISTSRCLELLHVDLMGPTRTESLGGKRYREKSEANEKMEIMCKRLQIEKGVPIVKIRSDHGKEFENARFESFCEKTGSKRNFQRLKLLNKMGWLREKIG